MFLSIQSLHKIYNKKIIARCPVIDHQTYLTNVSQNVSETSKYLHITGETNSIDFMISPIEIKLNMSTCPIPHSTPYIAVNRSHYVRDDKKLRFIPQIGDLGDIELEGDGDTEFEEAEDILFDFIYENLELHENLEFRENILFII